MAKTPLLSSIKKILREHHLSRQTGIPVDEIRERWNELKKDDYINHLTRRRFLSCFIGASATGLISSIFRKASSNINEPRIAIIGAGLAGLTAALTLADSGIAATIYEASETSIGGRMQTVRSATASSGCSLCHGTKGKSNFAWNDNQYTDPFAELIDSTHPVMLSLVRRFKLPLIDLIAAQPKGSEDTYYFFGNYYKKAQADQDFANLYPLLRADLRAAGYPTTYNQSTPAGRALDMMSIYEWIELRVPGGHNSPLGRLLDAAYNIEYGAETIDQSALNLIYLLAYNKPNSFSIFGESDERYRIAGGADLLPRAIASYLGPSSIKMGWKLEAIALASDGTYILSFNGRREVRADYVILAFPFAVLRNLDYSRAGFDPLKIKAIKELGAGIDGKMHLQFTSRYWNEPGAWGISNGNTYSDTGYQCTWDATRGQSGKCGILVNYTGGKVTASSYLKHPYGDSLNDNSVIKDAQRFLSQLEPIFPGISSKWNGKADESLAHLNPLWNSSYAYWRVGQYQTIAGYERVRQRNILFAGEHTSLDYQGWMEGAASEGIRAAKELLATLKKPSFLWLPL